MTCDELRSLAVGLALDDVTGEARAAALGHLATCDTCRALVAELALVADAVLLAAPEHEPPTGFESRVLARMQPTTARRSLRRWVLAAAAAAVAAASYPPTGRRSYGPMRSGLRVGPSPAESDETRVVLAMIETPQGLANVAEICATPGVDGVYVGPSDLCLAVGGAFPNDPAVTEEFEAALKIVREAAAAAGIAAGIHTASGQQAAQRLAEGYTLATVSSDLVHLEQAAAAHLAAASGAPAASAGSAAPASTTGY